jgi:hypothetical protein
VVGRSAAAAEPVRDVLGFLRVQWVGGLAGSEGRDDE